MACERITHTRGGGKRAIRGFVAGRKEGVWAGFGGGRGRGRSKKERGHALSEPWRGRYESTASRYRYPGRRHGDLSDQRSPPSPCRWKQGTRGSAAAEGVRRRGSGSRKEGMDGRNDGSQCPCGHVVGPAGRCMPTRSSPAQSRPVQCSAARRLGGLPRAIFPPSSSWARPSQLCLVSPRPVESVRRAYCQGFQGARKEGGGDSGVKRGKEVGEEVKGLGTFGSTHIGV